MAVSFASKTQELSYAKVADYLQTSALFENGVQFSTTRPSIDLTYGSAHVAVEVLIWDVHPWEERELAIVRASSCVTVGSSQCSKLTDFLLKENQRMRFGAFHLGAAGEVFFAHSILGGEGMDLLELQTCILSVVTIADTYDDLIIQQFGGQRALERLTV